MRKELYNRSSLWARILQLLILIIMTIFCVVTATPNMHSAAAENDAIQNTTAIAGVMLETQQLMNTSADIDREHSDVTIVSAEEIIKTTYDIPTMYIHPHTGCTKEYNGRKTLENANKITYGVSSDLVALASPDSDGFMKLDDRYLVAIGSSFNTVPGQYFDLYLRNGVIIKCIMGDIKDDHDTDETNVFTYETGCCSEFIIDKNQIRSDIIYDGSASQKCPSWNYPVAKIVVYDMYYDMSNIETE